ncbi:MAG: DUF1648 domain-containing protein [Armatimonadetes bacterium]|nr:DUF1648 domain-containing protein [Armatimonadota bacterium]
MKRFPMAFGVLLVGVAVSAGQILILSPLLPATVASHFGTNNRADGFMPREAFVAGQWVMTAVISALFLLLPALIRVIPDDMINLPDKEYWLAPERRETTLRYFADRIYAFGAATLALLAGVTQQVYTANIGGSHTLGSATGIYIVAFLLYTGVWVYGLLRRFSRPALPPV